MSKRVESIADIAHFRQAWKRFVQTEVKGEFVKPVTMVNNGYLHALNASFDGLFLREQQSDSLLQARRPMNFGTIQPCVRIDDNFKSRASTLHLGLFEIWGTSVLGFDSTTPSQMAKSTIREFLTFYKDYFKLDPNNLRVYYFGGGTLADISHGRAQSQDFIKPDDFSVDIWTSNGLQPSQLIPEHTNETLLLHLGNPLREHHSGYRNDIFIDVNGNPYEIATLNFISHQSVIENGQVIGIRPLPFYLREVAFGQERLFSALNRSGDVYELPHVAPLVAQSNRDLADALRVIHYVVSDGWAPERLPGNKYREHRKELRSCLERITKSSLGQSEIEALLEFNAKLQPWYQSLEAGLKRTLQEVISYNR